jgi:ABC-type lipoprotein export system ATPase subunit
MIKDSSRGLENLTAEGLSINQLQDWIPEIETILKDLGIPITSKDSSLKYLCDEAGFESSQVLQVAYSREKLKRDPDYQNEVLNFSNINRLRIETGCDKDGKQEPEKNIEIQSGEIVAIVGPTGSGKSQLLFDIESLAIGDTVSKRRVYLNDSLCGLTGDTYCTIRPIAHISQTMNFILDLSVNEFLDLHIECRLRTSKNKSMRNDVIQTACKLCGESFTGDMQLVSLSGGQSRALMISDAVLISKSPIVLIDEIENAGIDKDMAINFLTSKGEIALLATHDPIIALKADKRIILKNGAIAKIVKRTKEESEILETL